MKNLKQFKIVLIIVVLVAAGLLLCLFYKNKKIDQVVILPQAGSITIRGMIVCLPHKDTTGPQTLECAFGLKDEEQRYFTLRDTDPMYQNVSDVPMNELVEVTGTFTPKDDTKYQSIGIIEVTSVTQVAIPQRVTFTGLFVCLPHKDSATQTKECASGIKLDNGIHYALDFSLSSQMMPVFKSGDRFTAHGVLISLEKIVDTNLKKYAIEGMFSVTDLVNKE